jgi:hypothetical protein
MKNSASVATYVVRSFRCLHTVNTCRDYYVFFFVRFSPITAVPIYIKVCTEEFNEKLCNFTFYVVLWMSLCESVMFFCAYVLRPSHLSSVAA